MTDANIVRASGILHNTKRDGLTGWNDSGINMFTVNEGMKHQFWKPRPVVQLLAFNPCMKKERSAVSCLTVSFPSPHRHWACYAIDE
jgi:hypothetical protein